MTEKYYQIDIFDDLSRENAGNPSADVDERMNYSYNSQEETPKKTSKFFGSCYLPLNRLAEDWESMRNIGETDAEPPNSSSISTLP